LANLQIAPRISLLRIASLIYTGTLQSHTQQCWNAVQGLNTDAKFEEAERSFHQHLDAVHRRLFGGDEGEGGQQQQQLQAVGSDSGWFLVRYLYLCVTEVFLKMRSSYQKILYRYRLDLSSMFATKKNCGFFARSRHNLMYIHPETVSQQK
jgi:hypothetical protein